MAHLPAKPEHALELFRARLEARGLRPDDMTVHEGVAAVVDFFRTQRFAFHGSDWLLFQYGTYDWGRGRYFELNITRQFAVESSDDAPPKEDDDGEGIWQLGLTCAFAPTPALDALGSDHRWCESTLQDVIDEFVEFVQVSAPYRMLADVRPTSVELRYENAG